MCAVATNRKRSLKERGPYLWGRFLLSNRFVRGAVKLLRRPSNVFRPLVFPFLLNPDDLDRYVPRVWIELELPKRRPPEHVGQ
jgi:hypothetical protein